MPTLPNGADPGPGAIKPGEDLNPVKTLRVRYDAWRREQAAAARSATPPARQAGPPNTTPAATSGQRQGGGGGGGRGAVLAMMLSTSGWQDGGVMPPQYTQAGEEVSPPLSWTEPPPTTRSFALIAHDLDATNADGTVDTLQWMVWNIPAASRGLPAHVPQGSELADGSRQISVTGPYYRGPAAPATGPVHHYAFDLYALDTTIDVPAVGATVVQTRAAVIAAMAGHVRGKATLMGRFRYALAAEVKK